MLGDAVGPRDLSGLQLPLLGHVDRDERGGWQVFGADGEPMSAVTWFLDDLSAADCADSTARSYAYDLLRWLRFLAAVGVEWQQATRREVRDFVRWFRSAPNPQRARCLRPLLTRPRRRPRRCVIHSQTSSWTVFAPTRANIRAWRASRTSMWSIGTPIRITRPSSTWSKSKRKNEQQPVSRSARSRAVASLSDETTRSSRVVDVRIERRRAVRKNWSNSARRRGCSKVGSLHAAGTQSSAVSVVAINPR